jgi:hypothetical protein
MSQDMQTCITPVDMLHKDSMQPHGRKGFDRYAGAVACVDSYAGAMSGLGESRSDSSDGLRVWLKIMHRSASSSAPAADQQRHQQRPSTNSEVERIFGRLDNLTRRKRNPSSWAAGQVTTAVVSKPRSDPENLASLEATIQYLYPHALHRLAHHAIHRPAPNCPTLVVLAPRTLATSMLTLLQNPPESEMVLHIPNIVAAMSTSAYPRWQGSRRVIQSAVRTTFWTPRPSISATWPSCASRERWSPTTLF